MIEQINKLYENEVKDNEMLKSWVDKLADFILSSSSKDCSSILSIVSPACNL